MFVNETFLMSTATTKRISRPYVKSPLDSWYIGGILFMLGVIVVLLYANFYRENAFQILWSRLLTKLHIARPSSQAVRSSSSSSSNPTTNALVL